MRSKIIISFAFSLLFSIGGFGHSDDKDEVIIEAIQVAERIYMLTGQGGNIGLAIDEDYTLLIDDQFANLSDKIKTKIAGISNKPIAYLLNTHYHYDHTDGNANFSEEVGVIVAHENVRKILKSGTTIQAFGKVMKPYSEAALPALTFNDTLTIHQTGEEVQLFHFAKAHTGGDSVVFFKDSNVIHAGDLHFSGFYPFIDTSGGGSVEGYIKAQEAILGMIDDQTRIIPGHGPLSAKSDLVQDLAMLRDIVAIVESSLAAGDGLEQILENKAIEGYDASYGGGFLDTESFLEILVHELARTLHKDSDL